MKQIIAILLCILPMAGHGQNVIKPYGSRDKLALPATIPDSLRVIYRFTPPLLTTQERNSIPVTPGVSSDIIINKTTGKINFYNGQNWIEVSTLP